MIIKVHGSGQNTGTQQTKVIHITDSNMDNGQNQEVNRKRELLLTWRMHIFKNCPSITIMHVASQFLPFSAEVNVAVFCNLPLHFVFCRCLLWFVVALCVLPLCVQFRATVKTRDVKRTYKTLHCTDSYLSSDINQDPRGCGAEMLPTVSLCCLMCYLCNRNVSYASMHSSKSVYLQGDHA